MPESCCCPAGGCLYVYTAALVCTTYPTAPYWNISGPTASCNTPYSGPTNVWLANPDNCNLILYWRGRKSCTVDGDCDESPPSYPPPPGIIFPPPPSGGPGPLAGGGVRYQDCCKNGKCYYGWQVKWNCSDHTWGPVTLIDYGCGSVAGRALDVWVPNDGNKCTQTYYTQTVASCTVGGDCPAPPTAPAPPAALSSEEQTGCCACALKCFQLWTATYNCQTKTWTGPSILRTFCGPPSTGTGWQKVSDSAVSCTFHYVEDLGVCCGAGGAEKCPINLTPPALPDPVGFCYCCTQFCYQEYLATYDCEEWHVTAGDKLCLSVDDAPIGWTKISEVDGVCTYRYLQPIFHCCTSTDDCPDDSGSPPTHPDGSDCDCPGCPCPCDSYRAHVAEVCGFGCETDFIVSKVDDPCNFNSGDALDVCGYATAVLISIALDTHEGETCGWTFAISFGGSGIAWHKSGSIAGTYSLFSNTTGCEGATSETITISCVSPP